MRTFKLHKLIRDKVLADMIAHGQKVDYKSLDDDGLLIALKAKLHEEADEFQPRNANAIKELADILEVVETAAAILGADFNELRKIQKTTQQKRGTFKGRIFVETVTLPDGDKWAEYYASEPERFPEITGEAS